MINTLTSLRLIFALMVFGAHCYVIAPFFDVHFFKEGFVGVSFFFVLSGFIIAYNYQEKLTEHTTTKRKFWIARIARVYPLHWLTLLLAALLGGYVVYTGTADWCRHFLASLTLTQAYIPRPDYFFSFNSPSWSLCCEQLFYFCFPFLIPLARNSKRLFLFFLFCALLVVIGMHFTPEEDIKGYWYVNPITRFPDFIVGMLLFQVYRYLKDREISYSFYLIHLFVLLTYVEWQKQSGWQISWMVSVPVLLGIILLLSLLSYYRFEKPMNKLIKRILNN